MSITCNNINPSLAKAGNVITLTVKVSEELATLPSVSIASKIATVMKSAVVDTYEATYTVVSDDQQGDASLKLPLLIWLVIKRFTTQLLLTLLLFASTLNYLVS